MMRPVASLRPSAAQVARFNIGADEMQVGFVQYTHDARIDSWRMQSLAHSLARAKDG